MKFRTGFTLIELLVVMSLILVIMASTAPWIHRVRTRSDLKSTGQNFQGELYTTRLNAMKSAEAYVFRFQSESDVYEIMPKSVYDAAYAPQQTTVPSDPDATRSVGTDLNSLTSGSQTAGQTQSRENVSLDHILYRKSLPHNYVFGKVVPKTNVENDAQNLDSDATRSVGTDFIPQLDTLNTQATPQTVWSEPIFFFPNGRTSNGSLEIHTTGRYQFWVELTLRGLTGTARVGDIKM